MWLTVGFRMAAGANPCRAPRPASNTNVCSPASTRVLGLNRAMTGGGFPVPKSVTLKRGAAARSLPVFLSITATP
jgi:hypothetical protein